MFNKFMVLVAAFLMAVIVNAQDEVKDVTDNIEKATNDVQNATTEEKAGEIAEINKEEKAKEKQVNDVDNKLEKPVEEVKDTVNKKMAEDEALGEEEAKAKAVEEAIAEPAVAEEKGSSWFGWLWPFGGDDDENAVVAEVDEEEPAKEAPAEEPAAAEEAPAEEPVAVEEAPAEEPAAAEEAPVTEPVVEEIVEATPAEEESSWFGWLWPFGGDDDENVVVTEVEEMPVAEEPVAVEAPVAVEEPVAAEEAPVVVEAPVAEEPAVTEEAPVVVEEPAVAEEATTDEPEVAEKTETAETGEKTDYVHKMLYYFPNVFLDLSDIFTLGLGVGAESGLRLGATRYCQLGGNYGDAFFLEKGFKRQIGGGYTDGYNGQLGPLAIEKRYVDDTFGSLPEYIIKQKNAYMVRPTDPVYVDDVRDFWAIGAEGGWLVKINFQIHPIEFADFFTGLIGIDICEDDL